MARNIFFKGNDVYQNDRPVEFGTLIEIGKIKTFEIDSVIAGTTIVVNHEFNNQDLFVFARDLINSEMILPDVVVNNFSTISIDFTDNHSKLRAGVIELNSSRVFEATSIQSTIGVNIEHNLNDSNIFVFCKDNSNGELFLPNVSSITASDIILKFDKDYTSVNANIINEGVFDDSFSFSTIVGASKELIVHHALNNIDVFPYVNTPTDIISPGVSNIGTNTIKLKFDQSYVGVNVLVGGWGNARETGQVVKTGYGYERGLSLKDIDGNEWLLTVNASGVVSTTQVI